MDFYLVRHGEAFSESQDSRRPLSPSGRQAVERVGRLAAARNIQPSTIFHSGILRAQQTAEILADCFSPSLTVQTMSGLLPEDDPFIAKAELDAARTSVVLVGHLPHMNRLGGLLLHGDAERRAVDFLPAMMACFSRDGRIWRILWELSPHSA
ncbi:MAG TPA: phosphohistidine phosphatase SixA [Candidatus Binatia bacterium]|nr:phosphohistidine phosphatase SixA [Candidatus Binatia bacterium]